MKTIKVIFQKHLSDDEEGYLKIRILENRKKKVQALNIKIHQDHWLKGKQRVKAECKQHKQYNAIIEMKLKELAINDNELTSTYAKSKTLLTWFDTIINRTTNHGSRIKLETVRNKFKAYLDTLHKADISFADFTTDFIYGLRKWMLQSMDTNTVNHYLKMIKTLLSKASKEDYYHYSRNPFIPIEFKDTKKKKQVVNDKKLNVMLEAGMSEDNRLYKYKQAFLFQVFAQGMRSIDMQTLRWNMISDGKLEYIMYKTGTDMSVYLNNNLLDILAWVIKKDFPEFYTDIAKLDAEFEQAKAKEIAESKAELMESAYLGGDLIEVGISNVWDFPKLKGILNQRYIIIKGVLTFLSKRKSKDFIFHFLKGEDFSNIRDADFRKITEEQYKTIKHNTIVYNRNLKMIADFYKIDVNLSSHSSRHLFASLLLKADTNLFTIKSALGHQTLAVTQKYLSTFNNDAVDTINKTLSDVYKFKR